MKMPSLPHDSQYITKSGLFCGAKDIILSPEFYTAFMDDHASLVSVRGLCESFESVSEAGLIRLDEL